MNTIPFKAWKRGATFEAVVTYTPESGDPGSLSAYTITSAVMDASGKSYPATVVPAFDYLSFTVTIAASVTAKWALGTAKWDIKLLSGSTVAYTDTAEFIVIDRVTK